MKNFEHRKEKRYPCINIGAIYSPLAGNCINDLADQLYKAAIHDTSLSGLSFDAERPLDIDDSLLIMLATDKENSSDQLITKVCWCKKLSEGLFRIGVEITNVEIEAIDIENIKKANYLEGSTEQAPSKKYTADHIGVKNAPVTIDMICPACIHSSRFQFVENQPILKNTGTMPLYNCSNCGSTRSLPGMLIKRTPS